MLVVAGGEFNVQAVGPDLWIVRFGATLKTYRSLGCSPARVSCAGFCVRRSYGL